MQNRTRTFFTRRFLTLPSVGRNDFHFPKHTILIDQFDSTKDITLGIRDKIADLREKQIRSNWRTFRFFEGSSSGQSNTDRLVNDHMEKVAENYENSLSQVLDNTNKADQHLRQALALFNENDRLIRKNLRFFSDLD